MAMLQVQGLGGGCQAVIFPRTYARCRDLLAEDRVLLFRAIVDRTREDPALLIDEVQLLEDPAVGAGRRLLLDVTAAPPASVKARLEALRALLPQHAGPTAVYLSVEEAGSRSTWRLPPESSAGLSVALLQCLEQVLGPGAVHLR
jgi:DNA polymerase-3 subunit alpha